MLFLANHVRQQVGFLGAAGTGKLLVGYAVLVLVGAGSGAAVPVRLRRLYIAAVLTTAALWTVLVTALSGVLLDVVLAVLTALTCLLVGRVVTRRLAVTYDVAWPIEVTVGGGLVGLVVLLLGRVGLVDAWNVGALILVVPVVCLAVVMRQQRASGLVALGRHRATALVDALAVSRLTAGTTAALIVTFGACVVWASAPEIQYDAVYAKEWLPSHWVATGRISAALDHPVLNVLGIAQLLAVPEHALGGPAAGRFLQLLAGVGVVAAVWHWAGRGGASWRGPIAAVLVAQTPHVVWQASTAYDDLMLTLFALAAALAAMQLSRSPVGALRSGAVMGLVAGTCVAGKLHLAPFAAVLLAGWVLAQGAPRKVLSAMAGAAGGAALIALPSPLFLWASTGNPVFPQYNQVFRSPYYPPVNEKYNFPYSPDGSLGQLVRLPYDALREPSTYMEAVPTGALGVLPLVLVVAVFVGWRVGRRGLPVWIAVVLASAYWWMSFRYLRYALPTMVVAVALLAALPRVPAAIRPRLRPVHTAGLALGAVVVICVTSAPPVIASFWNIPEHFPAAAALGRVSDEVYQGRTIGDARMLKKFDELAEPGDVLVGSSAFLHARTLLRSDLDLTPGWELTYVLTAKGPLPSDPQQQRDAAAEEGVDWAVVPADAESPYPLVATLVRTFGVLTYAVDNQLLYRLADRPQPSGPASPDTMCDPTFSGAQPCWTGPLDADPGLTATESPGGVTATVPACPGATYRATATVTGTAGSVRITLSAGTAPASSLGEAAPGATATSVLTVPENATSLNVYVVAFGGAVARDAALRLAVPGRGC
jgi:4-amino-4-deoxy-L-arabinose transferase-like glycosyltransferase